MKKLLWLSDSPFSNTGYATISRNIINGLNDLGYECYFQAHSYHGQVLNKGCVRLSDGFPFNFTLLGAGREPYCKDVTLERIQKIQPDYYGVLLDTFMLYPWVLDMNFSPAKSFFYFPSDGGGGLPQDCDRVLHAFNKGVAMSKFAQKQAKEVHNLDVEYIPHAVDANHYRPFGMSEKKKARQEFVVRSVNGSLVKGFLDGKFVIGCVSRNQGRKMLDRAIRAFKIFSEKCENAVLYFHSDMNDPAAVFDINFLIRRLGLENRVVFSPMKWHENFEYKEMPSVYNVMDVFFLPTSGEGFGVPIIEAMSCEIPCVVTDYTTTKELLVDGGVCGIPVPLSDTLVGNWNVERAIMDEKEAVCALEEYYNNSALRTKHGKVGREKVLKEYNWKEVIPLWDKFLKSLDE